MKITRETQEQDICVVWTGLKCSLFSNNFLVFNGINKTKNKMMYNKSTCETYF